MSVARRLPGLVLLANLLLGLVLLWSLNERTEITLRVSHGWAAVEIDGRLQPAYRLHSAGGRLGLYMEDYHSSRNYSAPVAPLTGLASRVAKAPSLISRSSFSVQ